MFVKITDTDGQDILINPRYVESLYVSSMQNAARVITYVGMTSREIIQTYDDFDRLRREIGEGSQ